MDSSLEMAVQWWLGELTSRPNADQRNGDEERLLEDTGLLDKIRTGSLTLEVAE